MTPTGDHERHRLNDLLGMAVELADGSPAGSVIDVRVSPSGRERGLQSELTVTGLVVGRGRAGSLLGYDRRSEQGPFLLGWLVRRYHRHTGYVSMEDVRRVDWPHRVVRLAVPALEPLEPA